MRENYVEKMLATCLAILAVIALAFAYSDDVSEAADLAVMRSAARVPLSSAEADESGTRNAPDLDPFALPLVLPEAPPIDITAGVEVARWGANVKLTVANGEFRFQSDGLPNHEIPNPFLALRGRNYSPAVAWADVTESDTTVELVASPIDETITLNPVLADSPSQAPVGLIGVLINGAQLYNEGEIVEFLEPDSYEIDYVDLCNGHPIGVNADGVTAGSYHYHAVPTCTTDGIDVEGRHSSIVGVLIDGFPVYGSNDVGGEPVQRWHLDECGGHFGPTPEFPDGIYHYHLLDEIGRDPIPCLAGELGDLDDAEEDDFNVRTLGR